MEKEEAERQQRTKTRRSKRTVTLHWGLSQLLTPSMWLVRGLGTFQEREKPSRKKTNGKSLQRQVWWDSAKWQKTKRLSGWSARIKRCVDSQRKKWKTRKEPSTSRVTRKEHLRVPREELPA
jgi:hypothetical protein